MKVASKCTVKQLVMLSEQGSKVLLLSRRQVRTVVRNDQIDISLFIFGIQNLSSKKNLYHHCHLYTICRF